MFYSPLSLCRSSSASSFFSFSSRSAVKSARERKVPERKGKQKDTLYLANTGHFAQKTFRKSLLAQVLERSHNS